MPNFVLVGLKFLHSNKKNKDFYRATVVDSDLNTSIIFIDKNTFEKLKSCLFKDITDLVNLRYEEKVVNNTVISGYFPSIS